jgi:hypothetical protein
VKLAGSRFHRADEARRREVLDALAGEAQQHDMGY